MGAQDIGLHRVKTEDRFSWPPLTASLAVALCLYIGLYAWLCVPSFGGFATSGALALAGEPSYPKTMTGHCTPYYKFGGKVSATVFRPLQRLDERLFPKRWTETMVIYYKFRQ